MNSPDLSWKGQWFMCYGWRVFPRNLQDRVDARIAAGKDEYHHELKWSLKSFKTNNKTTARAIAKDFLAAVRHASDARPLLLDIAAKELIKHRWKHFTYEDLCYLGQRALHPARTKHLEDMSPTKIKKLLLGAIDRIPENVAVVSYCLPRKSDRERFTRYYLGINAPIPSAGELARECVDIIYAAPESREAKAARKKLNDLISDKTINGLPQKGPWPKLADPEYLAGALFVARALFKQLREVALLTPFETEKQRDRFLTRLYPWLKKVTVDRTPDPLSRLMNERSLAGHYILGHVVDMSRRTIEDILSDHRPSKHPQI